MSSFSTRTLAGNKKQSQDNGSQRRPGFDYRSVVLPKIKQVFQLIDGEGGEDTRYGKAEEHYRRTSFKIVLVIPGAEKATTEQEQLTFRKRGHGKMGSIEVRPVTTAPGRRKNKDTGQYETLNPSGLWVALC